MTTATRHLRHLWRYLARRPGHTLAILAVLTAGIAVASSVISTVSAFLIRPLPVRDIDSLVRVREVQRSAEGAVVATYSLSPATWAWWRQRSTVIEDMAAATSDTRTLTDLEPPERIDAALVTANFFSVLGIEPVLGRAFEPGEDQPGSEPVVVISHAVWQRVFDRRPSAVGAVLHLDGRPFRVVGVMPRGLAHPYDARVWTPLVFGDAIYTSGSNYLYAPARLRPGVDPATAAAALSATAAAMRRDAADLTLANAASVTPLRDEILGDLLPALTALGFGAALVLVIALFNSANLVTARSLAESRQQAIRLAVGARTSHLAGEALERHLAPVVVATLGALALTRWIVPPLVGLSGRSAIAEFDTAIRLDWTTVGLVAATSFLVAVALAVVEVVRTRRLAVAGTLGGAGRSASPGRSLRRSMHLLAGAQLVLTFLLLSSALAVAIGYREVLTRDRGFDPDGLFLLDVSFPAATYPTTRSRIAFLESLEASIEALPGVEAATACTVTPDYEGTWGARFGVPGLQPPDPPGYFLTHHRITMPGYFEALGIPLLAGRTFTSADLADDADAVIVSRSFAERYFPDGEAVGRTLRRGGPNVPRWDLRVVGVVGDVDDMGDPAGWDDRHAWYLPASQGVDYDFSQTTIVIRAPGSQASLLGSVRRVIASLDPEMAASKAGTMHGRLGTALSRERFSTLLYGVFAVAGLVVGVLGVYGMLSFLSAARSREFGIRLAIGARPGRLQAIVIRQAAAVLAASLLAGTLLTSLAAAGLAATVSMAIRLTPTVLGATALILALATLAAALPSCRRVARIDPSRCLREE